MARKRRRARETGLNAGLIDGRVGPFGGGEINLCVWREDWRDNE